MHTKVILATALCMSLTACATSPEQRLSTSRSECQNYGFKIGTDAYAKCVQDVSDQISQADRDNFRRKLKNLSNSVSTPKHNSVTCRTFGNTMNCQEN